MWISLFLYASIFEPIRFWCVSSVNGDVEASGSVTTIHKLLIMDRMLSLISWTQALEALS